MQYEISLERMPNYLYVTVGGPASFDNLSGVWKAIAKGCERFRCSNVLRDGTLHGQATLLDIYRTGNRMQEFGLPPKLRVAFVCEKKDLTRLDFSEAVIASRVMGVTIRNFLTRSEAEAWLSEERCT